MYYITICNQIANVEKQNPWWADRRRMKPSFHIGQEQRSQRDLVLLESSSNRRRFRVPFLPFPNLPQAKLVCSQGLNKG
ncbi:MAG: hypothetical protein DRN20_05500, partial [Thermoplasmata archaeon]